MLALALGSLLCQRAGGAVVCNIGKMAGSPQRPVGLQLWVGSPPALHAEEPMSNKRRLH